jgi:hypothetical protein
MKNLHTKALAWLLVLLSFTSCSLAFDDIETKGSLTPEFAVPLLETQYRLGNLMKGLGADDYLKIRPNGQFDMEFKGKYSETQTLNLFSSLQGVKTIPVVSRTMTVPFPTPPGLKIDSMVMKKGLFLWRFVNPFPEDIEVTITFFSMTKNGEPYTNTFMVPKDRASSKGEDMVGYTLVNDASGNMKISYKATMMGTDVAIDPESEYQFVDLEPKKVVGYFGRTPISLKTQNIPFDFFKNWSQIGEIRFAEPTLTVTVDNSFGFPVMAQSQIAEVMKKDGTKLPITGVLKDGFNIGYPAFSEMGKIKQTMISLNKSNSNIVDVINAAPTSVALALDILTNPDASNTQSGFILDDSGVKFKMDASLPLIASAKNFTFLDTMDINFGDFNEITDVEFKIITDNTLPTDINMQVYFANSSFGIIDSLSKSGPAMILKSAPVFNGQAVNTTTNTTLINMDAARFNNLRGAKKVIIKSILSTAVDGTVPVYLKADQKFFLRMGMKAKTKF